MQRILFPSIYKKNATKPIDENKVVFIESENPIDMSNAVAVEFDIFVDMLVKNDISPIKIQFVKPTLSLEKNVSIFPGIERIPLIATGMNAIMVKHNITQG